MGPGLPFNHGDDKTISIVHAAIRENERQARLAGNESAAVLWRARGRRWQEILQEGNRRGLEYMQQVASWTAPATTASGSTGWSRARGSGRCRS
jgi:hypothetical protein